MEQPKDFDEMLFGGKKKNEVRTGQSAEVMAAERAKERVARIRAVGREEGVASVINPEVVRAEIEREIRTIEERMRGLDKKSREWSELATRVNDLERESAYIDEMAKDPSRHVEFLEETEVGGQKSEVGREGKRIEETELPKIDMARAQVVGLAGKIGGRPLSVETGRATAVESQSNEAASKKEGWWGRFRRWLTETPSPAQVEARQKIGGALLSEIRAEKKERIADRLRQEPQEKSKERLASK